MKDNKFGKNVEKRIKLHDQQIYRRQNQSGENENSADEGTRVVEELHLLHFSARLEMNLDPSSLEIEEPVSQKNKDIQESDKGVAIVINIQLYTRKFFNLRVCLKSHCYPNLKSKQFVRNSFQQLRS